MAREMKDSGVAWIGKIPVGWNVRKIKHVANFFNGDRGKNYPSGVDLVDDGVIFLTSNNIRGIQLDCSPDISKFITEERYSLLGGAKIQKGDIIYCLRGSVGNCAINKSVEKGTVASSLVDIRPTDVNSDFLNFYLQSPANSIQTSAYMNGTCAANLSAENVANYYFVQPPIPEQNVIANFLNSKCAEIDAVLEKTRTSIKEYKKLKQAIITQAVTKGVRGDRPMKESGIEWIGAIPENWDVRRIKSIGTYRNGLTYAPEDQADESGTLVLRSSNVQNGKLDFSNNVFVSCEIPAQLMVQKGDILICSRNGSRELIGKSAIINSDICASFGAFMMIFRCECPRYMYYLLNSNIFSVYLNTFLTTTINQLTGKNFGNMNVVYCPDAVEQDEIVSFLDRRCLELDELIAKKISLINSLESYKKLLIYEYVTGKKEAPQA